MLPQTAYAQNESDISNFLKAAPEDVSKLISAYVQPAIEGVSFGMTGGWYTTAKAHKSFGFDIGVSLNTVFLPSSKNYFDPYKLNLSSAFTSFENKSPNPSNGAPSITGPKDETEYVFSYDPDGNGPLGTQNFSIIGPEGLDVKNEIGIGEAPVPVPMIQLGVGIIKNTDIKLRLVPQQDVGGSKVKMLGIGVMHDIKQHIGGIKLMPFDLSVLLAYNNVSGNTDLRNSSSTDGVPDSQNGEMKYSLSSYILQALISKKISVLTVYGGIGYQMVKTKVDVLGDYVIQSSSSAASFSIKDPVAIDFKNNGFKLNGGVRFKFGPVYLNGEYTLQKYSTVTVGLGFSVR
ncbi:MAG TPA: hypothetical protein PLJ60_11240 [Chryseolinea sp.]|nr:hypothetical protein [Chryseolinea sp.]